MQEALTDVHDQGIMEEGALVAFIEHSAALVDLLLTAASEHPEIDVDGFMANFKATCNEVGAQGGDEVSSKKRSSQASDSDSMNALWLLSALLGLLHDTFQNLMVEFLILRVNGLSLSPSTEWMQRARVSDVESEMVVTTFSSQQLTQ